VSRGNGPGLSFEHANRRSIGDDSNRASDRGHIGAKRIPWLLCDDSGMKACPPRRLSQGSDIAGSRATCVHVNCGKSLGDRKGNSHARESQGV
jgi:hypothetical protein